MILLDGPLGTALEQRGIATPPPMWSAAALTSAPHAVAALHAAYAQAGATVHTANTFRTTPAAAGARWTDLAALAVALARGAVPREHRVAGSIAPLHDCYRPDLSPADPRPGHRQLARCLADQGVDLLLCETFPHAGEALVAVEECVATGIETWVALTAGPWGGLLTPHAMARCAREAAARGAAAVLVNCSDPHDTLRHVRAIAGCGATVGVYANGGGRTEGGEWIETLDPEPYADLAEAWVEAGAGIVGSCCGTGPEHIRALARRLGGGA